MKGEESAVVPDPSFILDAVSGLYYHARDACKECSRILHLFPLSLSLSQILLHFMTLKFLRRWFFLEEEQVEELGFVMD